MEILHEAGIDPAPERGSATWADFLGSQAEVLLACDFFETVTLSGAWLHVLAVIEHVQPTSQGHGRVRRDVTDGGSALTDPAGAPCAGGDDHGIRDEEAILVDGTREQGRFALRRRLLITILAVPADEDIAYPTQFAQSPPYTSCRQA